MKYILEIECVFCHNLYDIEMTEEQFFNYVEWKNGGDAHIQNALPDLTDDERELLISGVCGICFDNMFKESD